MSDRQAAFLARLDEVIERHHLLTHPFYRAWSRGELTLDMLREYAKQYYEHVRTFPRYLSATHANCEHLDARQELLDNLMEEERGDENHLELWKRFSDALDLSRDSVENATVDAKTAESVGILQDITRNGNFLEGVAALYAYESQVPPIAKSKREGLNEFYGIDSESGVQYFTEHEVADVEHREGERKILAKYAVTDQDRAAVIAAAERSAKAMWLFLDGIDENYRADAECAC